jgi:hypothetical protein
VNFSAFQTQRKQLFITPGFLPISLKIAGSRLKRLTSTGHYKELVKQVAIASLKNFFGTTDDCMRVLVPIAHNTHHYNEPDICSGILFFNDECIANMHQCDSNRPPIAAVAVSRFV